MPRGGVGEVACRKLLLTPCRTCALSSPPRAPLVVILVVLRSKEKDSRRYDCKTESPTCSRRMRNSVASKVLLLAVLLVVNCECRRVRRQDLIPFPRVGKRGHVLEAEGWPAENEVMGSGGFEFQDDTYSSDGPAMSLLDTLLRDFHSQAVADTPSLPMHDLPAHAQRSHSSTKVSEANTRRPFGRRGALGANAINSAILGALWKALELQNPEEAEAYLQAHLGH
ncbi:uncharacterized protein LOC122262057 [Penaeus japonicus]|uniref:uncharacterized protein LOC122262057 n=1 Tax=Penaeus japonicus TaxID=27405 RepID=UPI001C71796E|nr:uncharacterized protein LOC122262057 [Penaeus japonicus]